MTGNAVVMGVVGISAPLGWLLVPGVAGLSSRPRVAALVAGWAAALIGASVVTPIVPGHRGDGWSLVTSGICLVLMPALSWGRQSARTHKAQRTGPTVSDVGAGLAGRAVILATSQLPGEVVATVPVPGLGVRVLIGMVMGDVADPRGCAREVVRVFGITAIRADAGLAQVTDTLEQAVRHYPGDGYVAATLVEVSQSGVARVIRCGGPEILAVPHPATGLEGSICLVADAGPGEPPLGLGAAPRVARHIPGDARIAVVTAGYVCDHYDDYADAVHHALQATSIELAAVQLLLRPATAQMDLGLAGPAVVLGAIAASR